MSILLAIVTNSGAVKSEAGARTVIKNGCVYVNKRQVLYWEKEIYVGDKVKIGNNAEFTVTFDML